MPDDACSVVVIGAGIAGSACAWGIARHGLQVQCIAARPGASSLYSGAIDDLGHGAAPAEPLSAEAQEFVRSLGIWTLPKRVCRLASQHGSLRRANGFDVALLDLSQLEGAKIAVCDVQRDDWDGKLVALALNEAEWSKRTGTRFQAVSLKALRETRERSFPTWDFARLHDDPERADWLAEQLLEAGRGYDAWLLGPWLGTTVEAVLQIRARVGVRLGECLSMPGGPAGPRFEAARDQLLEQSGIGRGSGVVKQVARQADDWIVQGESWADGARFEIRARAVVLALGGVAAGGIEFESPERGGGLGAPRVSVGEAWPLSMFGRRVHELGSLYGADYQWQGLAALDRVGLSARLGRVTNETRLFAAGDVVADRPRTVLEAVRSGIIAAQGVRSELEAAGSG